MSDILKCFKAFQNPKVSFRHIVYICAFVRPTCEYECALYQDTGLLDVVLWWFCLITLRHVHSVGIPVHTKIKKNQILLTDVNFKRFFYSKRIILYVVAPKCFRVNFFFLIKQKFIFPINVYIRKYHMFDITHFIHPSQFVRKSVHTKN